MFSKKKGAAGLMDISKAPRHDEYARPDLSHPPRTGHAAPDISRPTKKKPVGPNFKKARNAGLDGKDVMEGMERSTGRKGMFG